MKNYREDYELKNILENSSDEDIIILIDIITDSGNGRVSLSEEIKEALLNVKQNSPISSIDNFTKKLISKEIQHFGGNSLASLFRGGKGVLYKEIVCDVASHTGSNYNEKQDTAQIESAILLKIVEKSLEKMTEEERKQFFDQFGIKYDGITPVAMMALLGVIRGSGFAFYKMATIVAQATAKALLGRGLTFAATGSMLRGITAFAGPVGWAITGVWTAFDLASPAYRVTVPCVIQLAYMRQKALTGTCPSCEAIIAKEMNFCAECGFKLTPQESQEPNPNFEEEDTNCETDKVSEADAEALAKIKQFASDVADSVSNTWDKHAPTKEAVVGAFMAGPQGSIFLTKEELEAVGSRTFAAVSKAAATVSDAAITAAAVVKENPGTTIVGAVIGVGAVAAAPFTGGGSVLAATSLAASLTGAGGVAVAVAAVGAGAGAAISNLQNEKIKTSEYRKGREETTSEYAVKVSELKNLLENAAKAYTDQARLNEFIIGLVAIGFALAGCDGTVSNEERDCVEEYVIGMSKTALPAGIRDHLEKLKNAPPDFNAAILYIKKFDQKIWLPVDGLLEIISEADGEMNQNEKDFLSKWMNYKVDEFAKGDLA